MSKSNGGRKIRIRRSACWRVLEGGAEEARREPTKRSFEDSGMTKLELRHEGKGGAVGCAAASSLISRREMATFSLFREKRMKEEVGKDEG
jgi:hypothetical protein